MLIRSQSKEVLVNVDNLAGMELEEAMTTPVIACCNSGCAYVLGKYSSRERAKKVLDMIQEAYADAKLNEILLPDVCKSASKSQRGKDNTLIAKTIRKDFMKKMILQMPEDSEVE